MPKPMRSNLELFCNFTSVLVALHYDKNMNGSVSLTYLPSFTHMPINPTISI